MRRHWRRRVWKSTQSRWLRGKKDNGNGYAVSETWDAARDGKMAREARAHFAILVGEERQC